MSEVAFWLPSSPWDFLPIGYREPYSWPHWVKKPPRLRGASPQDWQRTQFLTVANSLLARLRREGFCVDHEHFDRKEPQWHGAVLAVRNDGHLFTGVGQHLARDFAVRTCAEDRAIAEALPQDLSWPKDLKGTIKEIILMGGQTRPWDPVPTWILPEESMGYYVTPCGACRDEIFRCGDEDTLVTLFPLNDGNGTILPFRGDKNNLEYNEAWTMTIGDLLPELFICLPAAYRLDMARGWDFIKGNMTPLAIPHGELQDMRLRKLEALSHAELEKSINKIAMEQLRYHFHETQGHVHEAHVLVCRINDGTWHMGVSYLSPKTSNFHPAIDNFIGKLRITHSDFRITDIFSTHCDYDHFRDSPEWRSGSSTPVSIPMLTGNERERAKKCAGGMATDRNGDTLEPMNVRIVELVINNPASFNMGSHGIRRELKPLLPNGYVNPRIARGGVCASLT